MEIPVTVLNVIPGDANVRGGQTIVGIKDHWGRKRTRVKGSLV
jgi:hypothetical protein